MRRKSWISDLALGMGVLIYLAVPFAYAPYLFKRLPHARVNRVDVIYMHAYGWLLGACQDNAYSRIVRGYLANQCQRRPGRFAPPPERVACGS